MSFAVSEIPKSVEIQRHLTSIHIDDWIKQDVFLLRWWILIGLIFSFITKKILSFFLGLANRDVKKAYGKMCIKNIVSKGMMFMLPFTTMAFLSAYFLHWSATNAFVSTSIMTAGTLTVLEISKVKGKASIINPIISTVCGAVISCLWLISSSMIRFLPQYIEAVIKNLPSLLNQIKG